MDHNRFDGQFAEYACDGDTIHAHIDGFDITATIERDDDSGPPWNECDGHGPVSEWTGRGKRPGERVLIEDRGSKRFYDYQEAIKIAKRDGWDAAPYGGTRGEQAARAVEKDFEVLRAWCNDEWNWCGIRLSVSRNGVMLDECAASLCGIEMNYPGSDNAYLTEVANDLLDEALGVGKLVLDDLIAS
jgi:hypothetical protein